jgi:hypothetical protein
MNDDAMFIAGPQCATPDYGNLEEIRPMTKKPTAYLEKSGWYSCYCEDGTFLGFTPTAGKALEVYGCVYAVAGIVVETPMRALKRTSDAVDRAMRRVRAAEAALKKASDAWHAVYAVACPDAPTDEEILRRCAEIAVNKNTAMGRQPFEGLTANEIAAFHASID